MILYLTYNDQPSGVYFSQVTDVVDHLNSLGGERVHLVALVSLRGYFRSVREIRARSSGAWVLPMVPRAHNWRINWIWLVWACWWFRPTGIIGRGVFATALALHMRRRGRVRSVCFDGRGAYGAEWEEYRVVDNDELITECARLEQWSVLESDIRIAVSGRLVDHWRERYGYKEGIHLVIPCTLGRDMEQAGQVRDEGIRSELGWSPDDVVLVYSGSTMGWQSLELLAALLVRILASDRSVKVLFLSQDDQHIRTLQARFPGRVARRWVPHDQVRSVLLACDMGLLVRSDSLTNRVASPTKFAEYLSAGIPVLISEGLGDLSGLVRDLGLGEVLAEGTIPQLRRTSTETRQRLMGVANERFTKRAYTQDYLRLKRCMGDPRATGVTSDVVVKDHIGNGLVSIVVPSFNKAAYIREMIASVQAQTHQAWELLFIDDASTDATQDIVTPLALADERIKLHFQAGNTGANNCRNIGIHLARGEYLVFLDADDVLAPHCLSGRLSAAAHGDQDLTVSTMEVFRRQPGDGTNRWVPSAKDPLAEFMRHRLPWSVMQPLWKRSFLLELGGFDTSFSRHQDVELHTRALLHPCVRYRTLVGDPDCFYRIAEERKVLRPFALMDGFVTSALQYYFKFHDQARSIGKHHLLAGIIYQTHVQLLHNRKIGAISHFEFEQLRNKLLTPRLLELIGPMRHLILHISQAYNRVSIRIPGVNWILYRLMTT